MPQTPPADPKADPPADPEAQRVEALDARFGKIEAEQAEQRGMLTTILDKVSGAAPEAPAGAQEHTQTRLDRSSSIADQVRQAVADVGAEAERKRRDEEHAAEHAALRAGKPEPEKPPRERQGGLKSRLQKAMYGDG